MTQRQRIEMDELILCYAFRYVLGRRSYAVANVCREIELNARKLNSRTRYILCHEISEALAKGSAGDRFDIERWEKVLKTLKNVQ